MVQAMVQHHAVSPKDTTENPKFRFQSDLVEGKGKIERQDLNPRDFQANRYPKQGRGCIILLHGAPGVGKTSTAGKTNHLLNVSGAL